jgi:hypothetical protein
VLKVPTAPWGWALLLIGCLAAPAQAEVSEQKCQ